MIDLELERSYFVVLEDGSSEFEYVVNQLLPIEKQNDFDLSEYYKAYTDGNQLVLTTWDNNDVLMWI